MCFSESEQKENLGLIVFFFFFFVNTPTDSQHPRDVRIPSRPGNFGRVATELFRGIIYEVSRTRATRDRKY